MTEYTHRVEFDDGVYAKIEIHQDDESYRVWADYDHAEIETFESASAFWKAIGLQGLTQEDVSQMVQGAIVTVTNPMIHGTSSGSKIFMGLERYRHSGDVYALCDRGNFPDRRWDVSPIVGWISPHPTVDEDTIMPFLKNKNAETIDNLVKRLTSDVGVFNDAISGNCWGYITTLYSSHGVSIEEDSCWGFLGDMDYCITEAKDAAKWMYKSYMEKQNATEDDSC